MSWSTKIEFEFSRRTLMELDAMTNCWLVGWLDGSILNNVSLKNIALIPFVCRINLNEVEFAGVYFHYFGDIKLHTGYNKRIKY